MRQFIRGERAKLSELAAINHIWEVGVSIDAPYYIVDFCCLGLDANGQVVDDNYLISYNQPDAPQDAIRMNNASNNGAIFTIYLPRLPQSIRRLVFTATLHAPEMPGGILGAAFSMFGVNDNIGDGHLTLSTPAVDAGEFRFVGQDFGQDPTLVLGELYWRDEWRFVAAGQPLKGELSTFLQTLTDGPLPAPAPSPAPRPATPSVAAPPRPPRSATWPPPQPKPPAPVTVAPSTPVPAVAPAPPQPRPAPAPPAVQATAPRPPVAVTPPPKPPVASPPTPALPLELPLGKKLQDIVDAAAPGSTLTLMSDEYEGPLKITKPLTLEGRGSALWSKSGPVVIVSAPDVTLHNFDIEITVSPNASDEKGIALQVEQALHLQLDNVRVKGRISGLGAEDGEWVLPSLLNLGSFAPRAVNDFHFTLRVPTPVQLSTPVEGISLSPSEVGIGEHQITLQVRDIPSEALLVGFVEVRSAALIRTIPLSGSSVVGTPPKAISQPSS